MLYNVITLLVIPVLSVLPFCTKRNGKAGLVWFAPLISAAALFAVTVLFYPYYLADFASLIATGECDFTFLYWLLFFVPLQFVLSLAATAGTYLFLAKRRRHNAN